MNLISQVLEKSVSMMESFQSVEEVNKQTKPNKPTKSNQTKSNQTKPNQTKPNQTKSNQTKSNQTKSMIQDNNTGQYAGVSREANIKATLNDRVRKPR